MVKKLLFLFVISTLCLYGFAQGFNFEKTTAPYQALTEDTIICSGTNWPELLKINIDFQFTLFDKQFSGWYYYSGGYVANEDISYISMVNPTLYDDLLLIASTIDIYEGPNPLDTVNPPYISYKIEGTPSNRILKFNWTNVAAYNDDYYADGILPDSKLNYQLWLYEGSNIIEFHYGPSTIEPNFPEGLFSPYIWRFYASLTDGMFAAVVENEEEEDYLMCTDITTGMGTYGPISLKTIPADGTVFRLIPSGVSVNENNNIKISLYPNPVSNVLNIAGAENASVQIFDILGNLMYSQTYQGPIDVQSFSKGTYIVKVQTEKGQVVSKFIK